MDGGTAVQVKVVLFFAIIERVSAVEANFSKEKCTNYFIDIYVLTLCVVYLSQRIKIINKNKYSYINKIISTLALFLS